MKRFLKKILGWAGRLFLVVGVFLAVFSLGVMAPKLIRPDHDGVTPYTVISLLWDQLISPDNVPILCGNAYIGNNTHEARQVTISLIVICGLIHCFILLKMGKLSARVARGLGLLLPFLSLAILISLTLEWNARNGRGIINVLAAPAMLIVFLLWLPGFRAYSLPSSVFSLVPLLLHYLILAGLVFFQGAPLIAILPFAYLPLAGYLFPKHRRVNAYWHPARLPRLAPPRQDAR